MQLLCFVLEAWLAGGVTLNPALFVGYLGVLSMALLAPFMTLPKQWAGTYQKQLAYFQVSLGLLVAAFLLGGRGDVISPLIPLLLIPFFQSGRWALAGSAVALALFATVPYWSNDLMIEMSLLQWAVFAVLSVGVIVAIRTALGSFGEAKTARPGRVEYIAAFGLVFLLALALGLYSPPLTQDPLALLAWHHWGAYISPVEALRVGGVPFRDFPVQYGIGPTLLIAGLCKSNCWNTMFGIVPVVNALYCGALVLCVLIVTAEHSRTLRVFSAISMFAASTLWTAYPAEFGTATGWPSSSGLRFLPLVSQLLYILYAERFRRTPRVIGHGIWAFNLFWSIEAAAFASLLWWSWIALRAVHGQQGQDRLKTMGQQGLIAIIATTIGFLVLLAIFCLFFGTTPEFSTIIAYFQNPPGVMPMNGIGPVWLPILFALMAIIILARGQSSHQGSTFACLIAMIATFSYYLSRSHDNNVNNLFPFILLVALCVLPKPARRMDGESAFRVGFSMTFLMTIIVFVATFNFQHWAKAIASGNVAHFGVSPLTVDGTHRPPIIPTDAVALIADVRTASDTAPLLFDAAAVMPFAPAGSGWTSVNNIANYAPLPPALVSRYIQRGAERYRRSGWIIVERENYGKWVLMFAKSYEISAVKERGRYTAYLMTPKS